MRSDLPFRRCKHGLDCSTGASPRSSRSSSRLRSRRSATIRTTCSIPKSTNGSGTSPGRRLPDGVTKGGARRIMRVSTSGNGASRVTLASFALTNAARQIPRSLRLKRTSGAIRARRTPHRARLRTPDEASASSRRGAGQPFTRISRRREVGLPIGGLVRRRATARIPEPFPRKTGTRRRLGNRVLPSLQ